MFGLSYGVCTVHDVERDIRAEYILGEANDVFASPVVIGSDDSCEVVIDHPAMPARAVEFYPRGHHFYSRVLPDGQASRAGLTHRFGPYEVAAYVSRHIEAHAATDLPVRFAARELGRSYAPAIANDPRAVEARRFLAALAGAPPLALDAELQGWCEDRVQIHFNSLTWATTPRRSLEHGRIIYTTTLDDLRARYALAWTAVEAMPFDHAAWAHVHRMDLWTLGVAGPERRGELAFAAALVRQLPAIERVPDVLRRIATELAVLHVMTHADDVSPVRPLAMLVERGIVPVALPDGSLLLHAEAAAVADRDVRAELDFVAALARDPESRGVYADFLEQRGDAAQARRIRGGVMPTTSLAELDGANRFDHAVLLLDERREANREAPAFAERHTQPPTATLELEGEHHRLHVATHFVADGNRVRVEPAGNYATIIRHADGTLWLHGNGDILSYAVNGRFIWRDDSMPLYDGDAIRITGSYYRNGGTFTVDTTAIVHAS